MPAPRLGEAVYSAVCQHLVAALVSRRRCEILRYRTNHVWPARADFSE